MSYVIAIISIPIFSLIMGYIYGSDVTEPKFTFVNVEDV